MTSLLVVLCIALTTPALAGKAGTTPSRDGGPGLHRLQKMGYNGPVKKGESAPAMRGGNIILYVAPPPLGSNANDGLSDVTPFQTIQFAFSQASDGDEIRVLPGTYNECINNTAFALGTQKNLRVIANDWVVNGNRSSTVIDGGGVCAEPFSAVNLAGSGTPGSRLEGFTVVNAADSGVFIIGSGTITENVISNNVGLDGGGVFAYPGTCYYGTSAIEISNNTIIDNGADDQGTCNPGGQACTNDTQCGTGTCAIFGGNGGGLYVRGKAVGPGGAIGCIGGDARVTVTNNVIDSNEADFAFGGGMYVKTDAETGQLSTVAITQNLISNNVTVFPSLGYGGGAWLGTFGYGTEQIDFDGNTVSSNTATGDGGGLSAWVDTQTLGTHTINVTNNEVVSNSSEGAGGGMDLFQISREVGSASSGVLLATDNLIDDNEAEGVSTLTFSPGVGGGVVINAWSEETNNPLSGISFLRNEVTANIAGEDGGGIGIVVRADADHADDGNTQDARSFTIVDNNLVTSNVATGGTDSVGGGIFAFAHAEGGAVSPARGSITMSYNTVADNTSDLGAGGIEIESYTILDSSMTFDAETVINVSNSIIFDNSGWGLGAGNQTVYPSISVADWAGRPDTSGLTLTNGSNSFFLNTGDNQAPTVMPGVPMDIFDDPLLDPGFIPAQCSPTIDAGPVSATPGVEPEPNGNAFNLGHTGGQTTATKTLADATGDMFVDGVDILRLAAAFATDSSDTRYDAAVDLDEDGFVGPIDLVLMAVNYAQSCM